MCVISFVFNRLGRIRVRDGCGSFFLFFQGLKLRGQFVDSLLQFTVLALQAADFILGVNHIAARLLFHFVNAVAQSLIMAVEICVGARREDAPEDLLNELPFLRCRAVELRNVFLSCGLRRLYQALSVLILSFFERVEAILRQLDMLCVYLILGILERLSLLVTLLKRVGDDDPLLCVKVYQILDDLAEIVGFSADGIVFCHENTFLLIPIFYYFNISKSSEKR